jgi:hypothetical protein
MLLKFLYFLYLYLAPHLLGFLRFSPSSIISLDMLTRKFDDHFYSGSVLLKLTDSSSVRQGRDEIVSASGVATLGLAGGNHPS